MFDSGSSELLVIVSSQSSWWMPKTCHGWCATSDRGLDDEELSSVSGPLTSILTVSCRFWNRMTRSHLNRPRAGSPSRHPSPRRATSMVAELEKDFAAALGFQW